MASNDQAFEYAEVQATYVENGDNDDDIIYDYAPAAWMVIYICLWTMILHFFY